MTNRILIAIGCLLVLAAVNVSIFQKENIKRNGAVIYLDLAPRDPRSLMQGDYMALRFRLAQDIEASFRGTVVREGETRFANVALTEQGVANLAQPGAGAPLKVRYRIRQGAVWLGTNAFFFQEGREQQYASARYGEFRLDRTSGEAVLVGLRDAGFKAL